MLAAGRKPEIFPIEEVEDHDGQEAEQFWVQYFKGLGADLKNVLNYQYSEETRKKRGERLKRMWKTRRQELRNKISAGLMGHRHGPLTRRKIAEAHRKNG